MITSKAQARDIMMQLVHQTAEANGLFVVYEDTETGVPGNKPEIGQNWVRIDVRHQTGNKTSLPNEAGTSRYEITGLLFIEIMTVAGDGLSNSDTLTDAFETALRERSTLNQNVWYTDVHNEEVGIDQGYYKVNVIAQFHYDRIQ